MGTLGSGERRFQRRAQVPALLSCGEEVLGDGKGGNRNGDTQQSDHALACNTEGSAPLSVSARPPACQID